MGPCPFRHGYFIVVISEPFAIPKLQWGHALSGMDTYQTLRNLDLSGKLQWGHALSGMDTQLVSRH